MAQQKTLAMYENDSERSMSVEVHACRISVHVLLVRACTASVRRNRTTGRWLGLHCPPGRRTSGCCVCRCRTRASTTAAAEQSSPDTQPLVFYPTKPGEPVSLLSEGGYGEGTRVHVTTSSRRRGSLTTSATLAPGACASTREVERTEDAAPPLIKDYEWQFFRRVGRRHGAHVRAGGGGGVVAAAGPRAAARADVLRRPRVRGRPGREWRATTGDVAPVGVHDPLSYGRSEDDQDWHEAMSRAHELMEVEGGDGCERRRRAAPSWKAAGRRPVPARAPAGGAPHGAPPQHVDVRVSQLGGGCAGKVKDAGREGERERRGWEGPDVTSFKRLFVRKIQPCCVQIGPATNRMPQGRSGRARCGPRSEYSRVASS